MQNCKMFMTWVHFSRFAARFLLFFYDWIFYNFLTNFALSFLLNLNVAIVRLKNYFLTTVSNVWWRHSRLSQHTRFLMATVMWFVTFPSSCFSPTSSHRLQETRHNLLPVSSQIVAVVVLACEWLGVWLFGGGILFCWCSFVGVGKRNV